MRFKKLKRSECAVLSLVLKRQWYDLIDSRTKRIEWRRADYWLDRVYNWFSKSAFEGLVPVVEFRHGYAKDARRMAFVCGWLWHRQKHRFEYCTPPYGWQSADTPVHHPHRRACGTCGQFDSPIGRRAGIAEIPKAKGQTLPGNFGENSMSRNAQPAT